MLIFNCLSLPQRHTGGRGKQDSYLRAEIAATWDTLDEDGSGEMDLDEFLNAVEKCGYFGPAKIVFSLLDSSDDGLVAPAEGHGTIAQNTPPK